MADDTATGPEAGQDQEPQAPRMQIMGQFIRDLSFENIAAQKHLIGDVTPDVQIQVNLDAHRRENDGNFEVIIKLNVESRAKGTEDKIFILELDYGGIFAIENVPDDQLHPFLLIECPRMIFPYVRRIVGDVSRDGGFPPLNLENIDFLQLYRQEMQRRAEVEKQGQPIA